MHRIAWVGLSFGILVLATATAQTPPAVPTKPQPPSTTPPAPKPEPPKGTEVVLDGLKSVAPADWKADKPANRLRLYQFRLPRHADDKTDAELAIRASVSGTVDSNIEAWKALFIPPPDQKIDDVAKRTEFTVGKAKVVCLDVHGTFLEKHIPIDKAAKAVRPNYRMISALLITGENSYVLQLVGPRKTVDKHANAFEAWVKRFQ
jgi:hypothetical protein